MVTINLSSMLAHLVTGGLFAIIIVATLNLLFSDRGNE